MNRIVTMTCRYKRPPRKRKAVALELPAIVLANDDRKPTSRLVEALLGGEQRQAGCILLGAGCAITDPGWMTYAELAEARGISARSATRMRPEDPCR